MDPSIVGMEEIGAIGNIVRLGRANRATRPLGTDSGGSAPMLANLNRQKDRIFHLILYSGRPSGDQTALAGLLAAANSLYTLSFHEYKPSFLQIYEIWIIRSKSPV
jgi:hypothetical protein